jgi:hypothetical protein
VSESHSLHFVRKHSGSGLTYESWHQDIKPSNVLVKGDIRADPYGVHFMLADLGLSHFANTVTDTDTHGAQSYSECFLLPDML